MPNPEPSIPSTAPELTDPDDRKLVTLARSARARTGATEGACLRDLDGRTYAAASVELDSLALTAVQVAVAMAVTSGAQGIEAAVVLGPGGAPRERDLAAIRDVGGAGVPVHLAGPDGTVVGSFSS